MRRALRVLMTTDAVGGVWRYALDACAGLARHGADAHLVGLGPRPSAARVREAAAAGVPLAWLDADLDWQAADADGLARSGEALARAVRRSAPDVVHVNGPALAGFIAPGPVRVAAAHSCIATWWRAVTGEPPPEAWRWHVRATAAGLAGADLATAPSRAFAAALVRAYGPLPALHVVFNGAAPVPPRARQPFVLAAGRWWDASKNLAGLDAAAARLAHPVRVAGPTRGPATAVPEPRHAEWLGEVPHDRMRALAASAAVFTSPSVYEPFGLAVLEAASAGAALVLADIPTFRELWGSAAVLVDPADPDGYAAALERVLGDPALTARLGAAARARAADFTLDRQAAALLAAYAAPARAVAV